MGLRYHAEMEKTDGLAAEHELGKASVFIYGRPHNFKPLVRQWQDEASVHPTARIIETLGQSTIAIPQVYTFSANTGSYDDFPTHYQIENVKILTGLHTDAVILKPGQAAGIVTGDCPTIVIENTKTGEVAAAHGVRNSNIDRKNIDTGIPSRPYEGVVASVLDYTKWRPEDLHVFVCAGIAPEHFEHPWSDPTYGEPNRAMVKWIIEKYGEQCVFGNPEDGRIDLFALIKSQCVQFGIDAEHIQHDTLDTYSDERLWSHRNRNKSDGRNIVIVFCK